MATKVITTTPVTKNLQHGFYQANGVKDTPALLNTIIYCFSNNWFTWAIKRALLRLIPYVNLKLCFKSNWKYIDTDFSLWWNVFEILHPLHRVDFSSLGLPFTIECGWEKIYGCFSRECKWPWMVWKWQPKLKYYVFIYRTRAIITRGLYFFTPFFTAVYIWERFILQSG